MIPGDRVLNAILSSRREDTNKPNNNIGYLGTPSMSSGTLMSSLKRAVSEALSLRYLIFE